MGNSTAPDRSVEKPEAATLPDSGTGIDSSVKPYAADAAQVCSTFGVDPASGLTESQVQSQREQFGANALQTVRSTPAWKLLLHQFASLIVALLGVAAIVSWITEDKIEAIAIVVVLILNALVGFATEWQASRALDALRKQAHTRARVRRNGVESEIDAEELVPGDIVILNAGDRIPGDARVIEAANLRAEESALTGESTPVDKSISKVEPDAPIAERHSMLYLGTSVVAGRAVAIITATGANTELGRIGRLISDTPSEQAPLERKLGELGRRLVFLVLIIAALVLITGWLRGDNFWLMLEVGISLAVAAVPEGLPAVTTLILALGVLRMARKRAIVRRLPAVETLGSTTIICSDKTGTLTENRMAVREYRLSNDQVIGLDSEPVEIESNKLFGRSVLVSILCNEASFSSNGEGGAQAIGDPTETALIEAAQRLGIDVASERTRYPRIDEIPFDSETQRMVTVHKSETEPRFAALKGAPAMVFKASSHYADREGQLRSFDQQARTKLLEANDEMAEQALRVLALAEKRFDSNDSSDDLNNGYTLLGLVGMIDPPRTEVPEAIKEAHEAGIRVVMLTGDQIRTAHAIARELKLGGNDEPQALHARDLEGASRERLAEIARETDVFARVSPEDKLRIVEALQQAGEIVAVTGDGVNDAPALKRSDIGIAMGQRGTEVAKEAADVVLADDNFATITKAVEGGRTIYANIIKFVHMMFSNNLGEVFVIFTAIAIGWPLPLTPLQILWVNLVTDVFPALALAVEPASSDLMKRPPRSPQESLLSRNFIFLIGWQGVMLAAITLAAYWWALRAYGPGHHAQSIALMALIGVQLGHLFNCRSRTRSAFEGLFSNPFIWAAVAIVILLQLLAVYLSPLQRVLSTVPPSGADWLVALICGVAPIIVVELTKLFIRMRKHD